MYLSNSTYVYVYIYTYVLGFPSGSDSKESACNAGSLGLILSQEDPLEKGMATHSSIPARRTPLTEESGGLQSMGSQSRTQLKQLSKYTHTQKSDICVAFPA